MTPFRENEPWTDVERAILAGRREWNDERYRLIADILERTEGSVRMKKDSLLGLYARIKNIGKAGFSAHSDNDVSFLLRYGKLFDKDFEKTSQRRAFRNFLHSNPPKER